MHLILIYPGGRNVDALLVSATQDLMRVVIRGRADTSEFNLIEGRWTSESGVAIELGAMLTDETADLSQIHSYYATAGSSEAV